MSSSMPLTRWSILTDIKSADPEERTRAFGLLVEVYWQPVFRYVCVRWSYAEEEAKDVTQDFFTKVLEKEFFNDYSPSKSRFRTYLRLCLDRFVLNEKKYSSRKKRGGEAVIVSAEEAEAFAVSEDNFDSSFAQEWVRSLFSIAVNGLRKECEEKGKQQQYALFERYDLAEENARQTYEELALEFSISVAKVTNDLFAVRSRFKRILLECLREITSSEEEYRNEARELLGIDVAKL